MKKIPVSISLTTECLEQLVRLPQGPRKAAAAMLGRFRKEPTLRGLNFEPLKNSRLASIRVTNDYRAIIQRPRRGKEHLLVWIDQHDEAYRWADRRKKADAEGYSVSVRGPVEKTRPPVAPEAQPTRKFPLSGLTGTQLARLGVPARLFGRIEFVQSEKGLDALKREVGNGLSDNAQARLELVIEGASFEEVVRELGEARSIDAETLAKELAQPDSQANFLIPLQSEKLKEMLSAPLEEWRVFLHPEQRSIAERHWKGPVRILGSAGTGKTVIAIHRARWLARHGRGRVLVVAYNKALMRSMKEQLKAVCGEAEMEVIDAVNLDQWAYRRGEERLSYRIQYNRHAECWSEALRNAPEDEEDGALYREWESVVVARGIDTLEEYLSVSRRGAGSALGPARRKRIWPVFDAYRRLLKEEGLRAREDLFRDLAALAGKEDLGYRHVIVDEAQDVGSQGFRLLRSLVPEGDDDLFIAGDARQRIYERDVVLSKCGINIVGRSRTLTTNYRTTQQTSEWAESLFEGIAVDDLNGGTDRAQPIQSLIGGPEPVFDPAPNEIEQGRRVVDHIQLARQEGCEPRAVCLVARTNLQCQGLETVLRQVGIKSLWLKDKEVDEGREDCVRISTIHRAKGLEFDWMILTHVNRDQFPAAAIRDKLPTPEARRDFDRIQRSLLYVAATRARRKVIVCTSGEPSRFLAKTGLVKDGPRPKS